MNLILKIKKHLKPIVLLKRSLINNTKEFFNNSTLHGVRYIAEDGIPPIEKFLWFCFTCIGTIAALIIIMSLWEKFQTNPIIIGLDTDFSYPKLLFPTVVLCPWIQYNEEKVNDTANFLTSSMPNANIDELIIFIKGLYNLSMNNLEGIYLEQKKIGINLKDMKSNIRQIVMENAIDCEDILGQCYFGDNKIGSCCKKFDLIYSEYGLCYAFNSKYKSEITKDIDLNPNNSIYETEREFSLLINPQNEIDLNVFVFWSKEYFDISFRSLASYAKKNLVKISVLGSETITKEQTRQLSIKQRKCIFDGEIKLSYFKDYSYLSCVKDCQLKKIIEFCKCIPPFYRPVENIEICDFEKFPCLLNHRENISNINTCSLCQISCSNINYNVEKMDNFIDPIKGAREIRIEFLNWPIVRFQREVIFGWIDLLVSFGGIAGLFLGFSLLSAVEIIYYFTLRSCCMIYKDKEDLYLTEAKIKNQKIEKIDLSLRIGKSNKIQNKSLDDFKTQNDNFEMEQRNVYFINLNSTKQNLHPENISYLP